MKKWPQVQEREELRKIKGKRKRKSFGAANGSIIKKINIGMITFVNESSEEVVN
jgi:hypothetical protein